MNPTEEQTAVVETEAPILVVIAFAGAGKTTTLVEFAKRRSQKRMLYIVFSKQNQKDAEQKFKGTMVLSTIVDMRSQNNRPTIIISNLEPPDIMENIVVRTMDRIIGFNGFFVEMRGDSLRMQKTPDK